MRKRKLFVILAVAVLTFVGVGVFVLWPREDRITAKNFNRIGAGMTLPEAVELLGHPGDYTTGPTDHVPTLTSEVPASDDRPLGFTFRSSTYSGWRESIYPPDDLNLQKWSGDIGDISVYFGPKGASEKYFRRTERLPQGPCENLLWRAKRQWRRWFAK
jgi:hypothetical protein